MGWTSPLPAVRMRAAMLVSAVVATCRGRLRRGAIREDGCWLTSCTDGVGFSYKLSQPDCLRFVPAPMLLRANNCDARFGFWLPTRRASVTISCSSYRSDAATARARTVARNCEFQTRGRSREEHAVKTEKAAHAPPRRRRRDDASVAHAIAPTLTYQTHGFAHAPLGLPEHLAATSGRSPPRRARGP